MSGNFGPNVNGMVRTRWKFSGQSGPPPEVGGGGNKGGPLPVFAPPPSYYDPWESFLAGYGPVEEILMGQPRSQVFYLHVSLSLRRVGEGVSRWVGENPGNEIVQWTLSNDDDNVKKQFSPAA